MDVIMKQNKILALQKQAKAAYQFYYRILDGYSCGATLAETISRDLYPAKERFNKIWEELGKLDPKCPNPEFRL
jgi:hypothetical protein